MKYLVTVISIFAYLIFSAMPAPAGEHSENSAGTKYIPLISSDNPALPVGKSTAPVTRGKVTSGKMPHFEYRSPDFDIPVEVNDLVWEQVESFQRGPRHVRTVLERGSYYMSSMRNSLFEVGCPRDMVFLAMIESNFSPTARSVMDAAGLWQFIPSTAKNYGLKSTEWIDERLDIVKSSLAAGQYLLELYDRFGDWPAALAAYNAGPGTINKAMKRKGTKNFWKIARTDLLKPETKAYVPRFYAALLVGKYPERFGIKDLKKPVLVEYGHVQAPPLTDIFVIAKLSGAPYEQLVNLNAQYLYECTPPSRGKWPVRVPAQFSGGLQAKLDSIEKEKRNAFLRHRVKRGQSLTGIARHYRMNPKVVLQANGLNSRRDVRAGITLIIPLRKKGPAPMIKREPNIKKVDGKYCIHYIVGEGDTLWKIAYAAGVTLSDLCSWNNIDRNNPIHPGQSLVIYCRDYKRARALSKRGNTNRSKNIFARPPSPRVIYHTIRPGESLSRVAARYNVTVKELTRWNKISNPNKISVGQRIKIYR